MSYLGFVTTLSNTLNHSCSDKLSNFVVDVSVWFLLLHPACDVSAYIIIIIFIFCNVQVRIKDTTANISPVEATDEALSYIHVWDHLRPLPIHECSTSKRSCQRSSASERSIIAQTIHCSLILLTFAKVSRRRYVLRQLCSLRSDRDLWSLTFCNIFARLRLGRERVESSNR